MALCSWMVYESARIAIENKMPVVCGSFDAAHPRIAFVLYVFYLSKVRARVGDWGCRGVS